MTQPMTPTDTVVSEATDTKHVKAMIEAVGHAGRVGVYHATDASGDLTIHGPKAKALLTELLDRRTATPQSGGVVVKGLEWREITSPREDGPAEPTGDVEANTMIGEYSVCFDSDEDVADSPWCAWAPDECIGHFADPAEARAAAQTDFEARIRSTLADPIPEAPADEEVEGLAQALRNLAEGAEQEDRTILYKAAAALRRSTETDKPGVREAAQRIVDALDAPDSVMGGIATVLDIADVSTIARALSASPLTEEQPTHRHKKRGTEYVLIGIGRMQAEEWVHTHREKATDPIVTSVDMREVAIYRSATDPTEIWVRPREEFEDGRFEPLPRSTTGGAK